MTLQMPSGLKSDKRALDNAIADPRTYADETLYHSIFAGLRQTDPMYWTEPHGFRPFWSVTKHADISAIELNPKTFLNDPRLVLFSEVDEAQIKAFTGGSHHLTRNLVSMDNPDHKIYRDMTQAWFVPKNIRKVEDDIRALARESIDRMAELGGRCDFVQDVALWFPLRVIMLVLGVPRDAEKFMMQITQEVFGPADPDNQRSDGATGLIEALTEFNRYFDAVTKDRRENPREDVASVIANATVDGEPIGHLEASSYYLIVATAGHDTTSSSSAAGLLELIRNPDELAKLRAHPDLLPKAVDEFIRWSTPVKHFFRTAAEDAVVNGQTIKAGDGLMMCYPSANRDEDVFEDPFAFKVDRPQTRHIAFGTGPHVCIGQHLAKMEIRILFEELLARVDDVQLDGEPMFTSSSFVSGLKRLPIRYTMKAASQ